MAVLGLTRANLAPSPVHCRPRLFLPPQRNARRAAAAAAAATGGTAQSPRLAPHHLVPQHLHSHAAHAAAPSHALHAHAAHHGPTVLERWAAANVVVLAASSITYPLDVVGGRGLLSCGCSAAVWGGAHLAGVVMDVWCAWWRSTSGQGSTPCVTLQDVQQTEFVYRSWRSSHALALRYAPSIRT